MRVTLIVILSINLVFLIVVVLVGEPVVLVIMESAVRRVVLMLKQSSEALLSEGAKLWINVSTNQHSNTQYIKYR